MTASNYPPGVTNAHPHFADGENVIRMQVQCEEKDVRVVPTYGLKTELIALQGRIERMEHSTAHDAAQRLPAILRRVRRILEQIDEWEDIGEWECTFDGDVDITIQHGMGSWDCPVCGTVHEDNMEE